MPHTMLFSCLMLAATAVAGHETGTASVVGVVFSGEDGVTLPSVTVCAEGSEKCVFSDGTGNFEIAAVPREGRVILTAEFSGFGSAEFSVLVSQGKRCEVVLVLNNISTIIDCLWTGHGLTDTTYGVLGNVVDSARHPVGHAAVQVRARDGKVVWRGHTDRKGRARVSGFSFRLNVLE